MGKFIPTPQLILQMIRRETAATLARGRASCQASVPVITSLHISKEPALVLSLRLFLRLALQVAAGLKRATCSTCGTRGKTSVRLRRLPPAHFHHILVTSAKARCQIGYWCSLLLLLLLRRLLQNRRRRVVRFLLTLTLTCKHRRVSQSLHSALVHRGRCRQVVDIRVLEQSSTAVVGNRHATTAAVVIPSGFWACRQRRLILAGLHSRDHGSEVPSEAGQRTLLVHWRRHLRCASVSH